MLAYSAGILPENRPATMEALIGAFDWKNVKTEDMRLPPSFNLPPVPLDTIDMIKDAAANGFHRRQRLFSSSAFCAGAQENAASASGMR